MRRLYRAGRPLLRSVPASPSCSSRLFHAPSRGRSRSRQGLTPVASVTLDDARRVLRETFGLAAFRPEQEAIVSRILEGQDVMTVWPPRTGLSTAIMAASLAVEAKEQAQGGVRGLHTIVLHHSQNAMLTSERNLHALGIHTMRLTPENTDSMLTEELPQALRAGRVQVLFICHSLLHKPLVMQALSEAHSKKPVRTIVLQGPETIYTGSPQHAINVRNALDGLVSLTSGAPRSIVCAVTAADSVAFHNTIKLAGPETHISIAPRLVPPNVSVELCLVHRRHDKFVALMDCLAKFKGRQIITINGDVDAKRIERKLQVMGIRATFSSAWHTEPSSNSTTYSEARYAIESSSASKSEIIILDRRSQTPPLAPDLRHLIHYNMPRSLSASFVGTRTISRDGQPGTYTIILSSQEVFHYKQLQLASEPSLLAIRALFHDIFGPEDAPFPVGHFFSLDFAELAVRYDLTVDMIRACMESLQSHLDHGCIVRPALPRIVKRRYYIQTLNSGHVLCDQVLANTIVQATRTTEDGLKMVDVFDVAQSLGRPILHTVRAISEARKQGWLNVIGVVTGRKLTFYNYELRQQLQPQDVARLVRECHAKLCEDVRGWSVEHERVHDAFTSGRCFVAVMEEAYGENYSQRNCGHCSACRGELPKTTQWEPSRITEEGVIKVVKAVPRGSSPRLMARFATQLKSQTIQSLKLDEHPYYGCMLNCRFDDLMKVFGAYCGIPEDQLADH